MKLVSLAPIRDDQAERLRAIVPDLEIAATADFSADGQNALLDARTDILYAFRVPSDLMDRAPNLKWLQLQGAGCDHLHDNAIMQSETIITTASGIHATPMAEYTLGLMLGHYRWLPQSYAAQHDHYWIPQADVARGSRELRRRTIGIIGYGSIGREIARLAKPFGTRILALKRNPDKRADHGYTIDGTGDPEGNIPDSFHGQVELNQVLAESDVIVLAMPVTGETQRMIGPDEFAAMKPGSFLINIARGDVLDESALVDALTSGPLAGAALDVFDQEPLPQTSPLWDTPNLLITPHISGASRPHLRRCFELFAQNLQRHVSGEPLINTVDRATGY